MATCAAKIGGMLFTVDYKTQTELFKQLSDLQEVFGHSSCGKCGGLSIKHVVRKDKEENEYFELHCTNQDCRAKLAYGQHKKGDTLFPKRKDSEDKWLDDNGWVVWKGSPKTS